MESFVMLSAITEGGGRAAQEIGFYTKFTTNRRRVQVAVNEFIVFI